MKRYHINVFWSDADKAWVADVPDLKTCSAFGDSPEEAVAEVKEAMVAWLAVAREEGHPIPKATYRPAIYAVAGGEPKHLGRRTLRDAVTGMMLPRKPEKKGSRRAV